eukprot:gene2205-1372_t
MGRNKEHKQRFQSKHALAEKEKGRNVSAKASKGSKSEPSDILRRMKQSASARREKKAKDAMEEKRLGSACGIPRIVGIVPGNESGNTSQVLQGFCGLLETENHSEGPFTVYSKSRKCAFTFICEKNCNDQDCVDVGKIADVIVLTLDTSKFVQDTIKEVNESQSVIGDNESMASTWYSDVGLCITEHTRALVANLNSQGAPNVVVVLQNTHTFDPRQRQRVIKLHTRYFLSVLHDTTKVFAVVDDADYEPILRHIHVTKLRSLNWREQRPYMAVEGVSYNYETMELTICGILRGQNLSAKQLVHLTNHGTFQVSSIYTVSGSGEKEVIEASQEPERESLAHVQANATLENEEMITEDDVQYAKKEAHARKIRVPAGVSHDQAAWYDTEENAVDIDDSDENKGEGQEDEGDTHPDEVKTYRTAQTDVDFLKADDIIRHERMTEEERAAELEQLRTETEEEVWNPDMVDTPLNLPARQRFAKYRGLKSFHTGKWDPAENLPPQYAYIYKLQGYSRIRKAALQSCAEGPATVGQQIYVTLVNVPKDVYENQGDCLVIASGQLEHEQKWSVLHFQVQQNGENDEPIKSKTPMLAHIGFRKYYVAPLFSDLSSGDRTKFARYFSDNEKFRLATFYGPITYNPAPILLFRVTSLEEQAEGDPLQLCCFGSALPPNPDFLMLKKAILTGRVAVIHKKQIVVKYMFFNEEDVKWFQPVDLYTKFGRRGKILKPIGTHGLFKAVLNDQVMQHDVVCMDLYKRVFPKWTTVAFNRAEMVDYEEISNEED